MTILTQYTDKRLELFLQMVEEVVKKEACSLTKKIHAENFRKKYVRNYCLNKYENMQLQLQFKFLYIDNIQYFLNHRFLYKLEKIALYHNGLTELK